MTQEIIKNWQEDVILSFEQWRQIADSVSERLGTDAPPGMALLGGHNGFPNWTRLAPNDIVQRLRGSDDRPTEVINIAHDLHNRVEPQSPPYILPPADDFRDHDIENGGALWHLASLVIGQYSGTVDFEKLNNSETPAKQAQDEEVFESGIDVFVQRWNERNMQDVAVFSIDSIQDFFGEAFRDETLMFDRLRRSQEQPEYVATDVAYNPYDYSWGDTSPPNHSISVMEIDNKNRVNFWEIPEPAESCEDTWGDVTEMMSGLSDDEYISKYSCEMGWGIVLGI